ARGGRAVAGARARPRDATERAAPARALRGGRVSRQGGRRRVGRRLLRRRGGGPRPEARVQEFSDSPERRRRHVVPYRKLVGPRAPVGRGVSLLAARGKPWRMR